MDSTDRRVKMKGWCIVGRRFQEPVEWWEAASGLLGSDGANTYMVKRSAVSEAVSREASPEVARRLAALLTEVIGKKWNRKDAALAKAAGIHPSGLSILKTKGVASVTPSLRSVCSVIGVDADALMDGRVEDVEPMSRRPDLHAMLESVVGTPDEIAVEQVLRAFIKARKH